MILVAVCHMKGPIKFGVFQRQGKLAFEGRLRFAFACIRREVARPLNVGVGL